MFEKQRLNQILEDLVGSSVHIDYVSSGGQQNEVSGVLQEVDKDIIQVKENGIETTTWINRHGSVLTNIRLLKKRKSRKRKDVG